MTSITTAPTELDYIVKPKWSMLLISGKGPFFGLDISSGNPNTPYKQNSNGTLLNFTGGGVFYGYVSPSLASGTGTNEVVIGWDGKTKTFDLSNTSAFGSSKRVVIIPSLPILNRYGIDDRFVPEEDVHGTGYSVYDVSDYDATITGDVRELLPTKPLRAFSSLSVSSSLTRRASTNPYAYDVVTALPGQQFIEGN